MSEEGGDYESILVSVKSSLSRYALEGPGGGRGGFMSTSN